MIKPPVSLQDLRRSLYVKAKAESSWRFWGLYVHVCKMETLCEAYQMAPRTRSCRFSGVSLLHIFPPETRPQPNNRRPKVQNRNGWAPDIAREVY
jgi:hypothetical protein